MFENNADVYNYKNKNIDLKSNNANLYRDKLRQHCVSVRLNKEELQFLNEKRGNIRKGEWLRKSFLNTTPPPHSSNQSRCLERIREDIAKPK